MKKIFLIILLAMCLTAPGWAVETIIKKDVVAIGELPATVDFKVQILNGQGGVNLSPKPGNPVASSAQVLKITFNNNSPGFQAILIATDNRSPLANPRYTGKGSGSGLIHVDQTNVDVPMHWVVFNNQIPGGYKFVPGGGQPINPDIQFFVQDLRQNQSTDFPVPWYSPGYGSIVFGITNKIATLAKAPIQLNRTTQSGTIYVYLGANFQGKPRGIYRSRRFYVGLVSIEGNWFKVLKAQRIPVYAKKETN